MAFMLREAVEIYNSQNLKQKIFSENILQSFSLQYVF